MTSKLEQEFFRIFGIEPKTHRYEKGFADDTFLQKTETYYPEITSDILLQLIQLLMANDGIKIYPLVVAHDSKDEIRGYNIICEDCFYNEYEEDEELEPISVYAETFKDGILKAIILVEESYKGYLKHQGQQLFSE